MLIKQFFIENGRVYEKDQDSGALYPYPLTDWQIEETGDELLTFAVYHKLPGLPGDGEFGDYYRERAEAEEAVKLLNEADLVSTYGAIDTGGKPLTYAEWYEREGAELLKMVSEAL